MQSATTCLDIHGIGYDVFDKSTFLESVSCVQIVSSCTYDTTNTPVVGGLKDLRLGATPGHPCRTCYRNARTCPGHMGHIDLVVPIWHPIFGYNAAEHWKQPCIRARQTVPPSLTEKETGTVISAETFLESIGTSSKCVMEFVAVLPNCVRPTSFVNGRRCGEDDLTRALMRIVNANDAVRRVVNSKTEDSNAKVFVILEKVKVLQREVCAYINDHGKNVKRKSLRMRLDGKGGRFRSSLMGKRCDYTMRAVVTGNPRLQFDEYGIPESLANNMTVRVQVTPQNINKLLRTTQISKICLEICFEHDVDMLSCNFLRSI